MTAGIASLRGRLNRLERRRGSAVATVIIPFGRTPAERAALAATFVPPPGTKFVLELHQEAPSITAWEIWAEAEWAELKRARAAAADAPDAPPATIH